MESPAGPRVLAVLVVHDGKPWLSRVLDHLQRQSYGQLEIIAVDSGSSDGSRQLLVERLGYERVLVSDEDIGFGAAVSMALDGYAGDAEFLWLLHDDLAMSAQSLEALVGALASDPRLAVAGPKLRHWNDPEILQSVGWTIDSTGRADAGVDDGELDQGQSDQQRRVLYVSTAGMLIRREVFERLGRFDRRFHVFRDDLDLCWRVWLSGHDVEVVPEAVGEHVAAASTYVRLGQTRFVGPRYFAERNTLATLLKNYSAARLARVLVLYVLVGIAKVVGFLLTRRFSDAWQTVRAWFWNLRHLRGTLRARRAVGELRVRSDRDFTELFGRITPRVRAYAEAIADWIAGGDHSLETELAPEPERLERTDRTPTLRVARRLASHPISVSGILIALIIGIGSWPMWLPGELRGGQLASWPVSPSVFFADYSSGLHDAGGLTTTLDPSPAQPLLGLLHLLVGGNSYLAARLLLFGCIVVGWLLALQAAQVYSARRLPRVVAAAAYVLSPPSLAIVASGQVGSLVVLAAFPGIAAAAMTLSRREISPERAWRAVSGLALLTAVAGAFEPLVLIGVTGVGLLLALVALILNPGSPWRRRLTVRVVSALAAAWALTLPWSVSLLQPEGPLEVWTGEIVASDLWRWLLMSPEMYGFPGVLAGVGFLLAGLLGLVFGVRRAPLLVSILWIAAIGGATGAWLLGRTGSYAWPGLPLIVTAAAFAGLLALAFASAERALSRFGFGWRQLAAGLTVLAITASLGSVAAEFLRGPWQAYAVDDHPLPAFVTAQAEASQPFLVLVLGQDADGVRWEIVDGGGPSMASYGVPPSRRLVDVDQRVGDLVERSDPHALARLGTVGVRYVFVPSGGTAETLDASLRMQLGVEARPLANGRLLEVSEVLPPVSVVAVDDADFLIDQGYLPDDAEVVALQVAEGDRYLGSAGFAGQVVIAASEPDDEYWRASTNQGPLDQMAGTPVVFEAADAQGPIFVEHIRRPTRGLQVTGQLLAVILVVSLALRPPNFARRTEDESGWDEQPLPEGLWRAGGDT